MSVVWFLNKNQRPSQLHGHGPWLMCEVALRLWMMLHPIAHWNIVALVKGPMTLICNKVCGCYSITFLNHIPTIDWCVVQTWSKNKCRKDLYLKEIELRLQFLLIIPYSIVNTFGRTYVFDWEINKHPLPIIYNDARMWACECEPKSGE